MTVRFPEGAVLKYDPLAQAAYLKIRDGAVHQTKEEAPNVHVDLDARGRLLGVEILSLRRLKSERALRPILKKISRKFRVPELLEIDPQAVPKIYQPA